MQLGGQNQVGRFVSPEFLHEDDTQLQIRWSRHRASVKLYTLAGSAMEHMLYDSPNENVRFVRKHHIMNVSLDTPAPNL